MVTAMESPWVVLAYSSFWHRFPGLITIGTSGGLRMYWCDCLSYTKELLQIDLWLLRWNSLGYICAARILRRKATNVVKSAAATLSQLA